jgi:hypothetical protein
MKKIEDKHTTRTVLAGLFAILCSNAGLAQSAVTQEAPRGISVNPGFVISPIHNPDQYSAQVLPLDYAVIGDGIIAGTANGVAVVYVDGQVIPLPTLPGYFSVGPTAISSNGFIVGVGNVLGPGPRPSPAPPPPVLETKELAVLPAIPVTYTRGLFWPSYSSVPTVMGALGRVTQVFSVNSQGVAVGASHATSLYDLPEAIAWSSSGGIRSIAPPNSEDSQAFSISDTGYVAGEAQYGNEQAATRWYPPNFAPGTMAYGDFGWTAMDDGTIDSYTTSWNLGDQAQSLPPNILGNVVYDVSRAGREVGFTLGQNGGWTVPPGGTTAQMLPAPAGATSFGAYYVDTCGTIVGSASFADGSTKAVMWSKLPCDNQLGVALP